MTDLKKIYTNFFSSAKNTYYHLNQGRNSDSHDMYD